MAATSNSTNSTAIRPRSDTAQRILDSAEQLVQSRGFNAFSYADVAEQLGITKASLHYHFRGKAELGEALITRYSERFAEALDRLEHDVPDPPAKLMAYSDLYADVVRGRRMCLCGMLAAEHQTLPDAIRSQVIAFFDANERWLARVLEAGRTDGTLAFRGSARETARMMISGLEGAMLVARPYGQVGRFEQTADALLATLTRVGRSR